jgi:hypothetical protein
LLSTKSVIFRHAFEHSLTKKLILITEAMQHAEQGSVDQFGIPNFALMQSVGQAAAHSILAKEKPQNAVNTLNMRCKLFHYFKSYSYIFG